MNEQYETYLLDLGMGDPFRERVAQQIGIFENLGLGEATDMFVSEYRDQDGERHFETLAIFAKTAVVEVGNFILEPIIWVATLQQLAHIELRIANYDLVTASNESRMSCIGRWDPGKFMLQLKASARNCDELARIVRAQFTPILATKR